MSKYAIWKLTLIQVGTACWAEQASSREHIESGLERGVSSGGLMCWLTDLVVDMHHWSESRLTKVRLWEQRSRITFQRAISLMP